jgi:regulation of enolase protein 1 (concanavalin A-like superfamily)
MDQLELPELPFLLRPYGPEGNWLYEDGAGAGVLTGWAGARQDRFVPPTGEALDPASDAPRLLGEPPEGDFQLIARVTVGFASAFDAGALYVHVGDREWAKLCLERSPELPTVCTVVTRGHSDDANSFAVDGSSVWLRVSRTGGAFAFHASTNGDHWTFVRIFSLGSAADAAHALVGFMAQSPVGEGCVVTFDGVEFRDAWPEGLRDGR